MKLDHHIVVMGVAGCGKSTIGKELAKSLGYEFLEGDDYHSQSNVRKMVAGESLTDEDREPWLSRLNKALRRAGTKNVLSCSALKRAYREVLSAGVPVKFIYLEVSEATVRKRVMSREHFFPESLVRDQFSTLEPPESGNAIRIDANLDFATVMACVVSALEQA